MRFVMTPVGSAGDVHPFVAIGRALRSRGHEVVVATAEPFGNAVRRAGLGFHQTISADEFDAAVKNPDLWHPYRGLRVVLGEVASRLRPGYEHVKALYEPGRTVLVGHSISFFTRVFEELHGAPAATLHLAPSVFRSDYQQPAYAPGLDGSTWPRWIKRSAWWTIDRLMVDPPIAPALNAWRRDMGLPPVDRPFRDWIHSPRRVVGLFPDWFGQPQPDWPKALRLTGFPLYDESDHAEVPMGTSRFMDAGSPPIVFTPGSANQQAAGFFRAAVDASARLGRRALLLTRYPAQLPPLPPFAHHESFVPLSKVLPRCAALVHHGGIGTLAQGLAAGIPQLTMPMGFDQPDNATRLHRLGVGRWIRPSKFTGQPVADALHELIEDPHTRMQCRHWANRMGTGAALDQTCRLLEELA
ncbi:MAG TPA: glycosyltransferase [Vicinamibacterales bacterium]|nr:glycosyltransferase [Vicinamibacterales bacterium]